MSGGNAPGNAPTNTALGDFCFSGVYTKADKIIENTDSKPTKKLSCTKNNVPNMPINKLSTNACPVVVRPAGSGLSAVRFINLSRSRSIISLKPLAAPVTKNPPTVRISQFSQMISPCCLAPIKKDMEAEKTTVSVSLSFTSLLKSEMNCFMNNIFPSFGEHVEPDRQISTTLSKLSFQFCH